MLRMVDRVDVAIIGAGPYDLSLAAYLRAAGVEHRVFGHPRHVLNSRDERGGIFQPEKRFGAQMTVR